MMLANNGNMDQFQACGFKTVKAQMKLKKLLSTSQGTVDASSSSSIDASPI